MKKKDNVIRVEFASLADEIDEELDQAIAGHPAGKAVPAERAALLEAKKWAARIDVAREGYASALDECRELGLSNTVIARAVGKTEAAIRMHFGRRKE